MQIQAIGMSDGDYGLVPSEMGDAMLCLRAVVPNTEQFDGAVFVPDSLHRNERMFHYEIVRQGSRVNSLTGLNEGDFVFVDMLARFADTFPISFIRADGVLFRTDADARSMFALKGRLIAKVVEPSVAKAGGAGLVRISDIDPYGEVVSAGEGCEGRGIKVGDRVGLNHADDSATYMFRGEKYFDMNFRTPKFRFTDR